LVAGYLLVGVINKNQANINLSAETTLPDTSSQTVPPSAIGDGTTNNPILTVCEQKWTQYASTIRFGSAEQGKIIRDNFITDCLSTTQQ
jgi:hypothetical protein